MSSTIYDASNAAARRACLGVRPASARRHKGGCSSSEVARAASANKIKAEDWAFAAARNGMWHLFDLVTYPNPSPNPKA